MSVAAIVSVAVSPGKNAPLGRAPLTVSELTGARRSRIVNVPTSRVMTLRPMSIATAVTVTVPSSGAFDGIGIAATGCAYGVCPV